MGLFRDGVTEVSSPLILDEDYTFRLTSVMDMAENTGAFGESLQFFGGAMFILLITPRAGWLDGDTVQFIDDSTRPYGLSADENGALYWGDSTFTNIRSRVSSTNS